MEFYEISQKIKNLRKAKKLSQDHLAKQVGISRQTLSKLEKGEIGKISLQVFIKILEALDHEMHIEEKKPFYYFDPKSVE
jgi:transcriptional regulator with XRE-family HTH domain